MSDSEKSSRLKGFYNLSIDERLQLVAKFADLTEEEVSLLKKEGALPLELADRMIENVIGTFPLPYGVATNFKINGKDYLIPMALEEPSVVAAASNMAKLARNTGGFFTSATDPIMIGQIQVVNVPDPEYARMLVLSKKDELIAMAREIDPILVKFGGGARDIEARVIETPIGPMLIVHLLVDCRDAMGANTVNTQVEKLAPKIEELTGGKVYLRIISNLADRRLVRAWAKWKKEDLGGEDVVDGILNAYYFAISDPYRCATHNKGIMNGIDPVIIATGNDWRAIEAGAHTWATRFGDYTSLTTWEKDRNGDLVGTIELPMAVGTVGGATRTHPLAKISLKILGVKTAVELAQIIAAVGLAQNLGALRALATEGIQRGHMELHSRNIAVQAGAKGDEIDIVAERMVKEGTIRVDRAEEILKEIRGQKA